MKLNQWRNTETAIDWFKGIRNKHSHKFVIFDNKEFPFFHHLKSITFAEAHSSFR